MDLYLLPFHTLRYSVARPDSDRILKEDYMLERMGEAELAALREVAETARDFVAYYDAQVHAAGVRGSTQLVFAPRTIEMVEQLRPALRSLDEARDRQAA